MNIKKSFTRAAFADHVFQAYNAAVKRNEYDKIDYDIWRKLRGWLYDPVWEGYEIRVTDTWRGFTVALTHSTKTCPVNLHFDFDTGFGKYMYAKWTEEMTYYCNEFLDSLREPVQIMADSATSVSCALTSFNDALSSVAIGSDSNTSVNFECSSDNFYIDGVSIDDHIKKLINAIDVKEKENKPMNFNFDFGPVDSSVRMSLYGMAIKNASGTYVAYDANSKQIMDVDIFNFEGANKFIYKMPTPIKGIRSGDVVIHARKPMFVQMVQSDNRLKVLDIYDGEEKTIVPAKSPFNFDFITKVVSLVDMTGVANAENPFGNMLPFLLMNSNNNDDMLPFLLMSQNGVMAQNPMLMYLLMNKGKTDDITPLLMMMSCGNLFMPAGNTGACAGNCHCHKDTSCDKEG